MNPAAVSSFVLTYDLCQPIPAPENVAIETAVANGSRCTVSVIPMACCFFLRDWDERGGGLSFTMAHTNRNQIRNSPFRSYLGVYSFVFRQG